MARPALYTKNLDELVRRAQANKRNGEFVSFTGLSVPNKKADREAYDAQETHDARKEIRATFGIPYPIIDGAQQLVENDAQTLVRVAKAIAAVGDGVRWSSAAANGILAKVERGTVDVDSFLAEVAEQAQG